MDVSLPEEVGFSFGHVLIIISNRRCPYVFSREENQSLYCTTMKSEQPTFNQGSLVVIKFTVWYVVFVCIT